MSAPSIREIARTLGLSHTTVSEALRDSPRVNPATRRRVQKAAKSVGYRPNPLAGALMSEMRRARSGTFRGVLAILDLDGPENRPASSNRYHRELAARFHSPGPRHPRPAVVADRGRSRPHRPRLVAFRRHLHRLPDRAPGAA